MNTQQLQAYEIVSSYGEGLPIHSLNRAYLKGQVDRDLFWVRRWKQKDKGRKRSQFKSAVEDILTTDVSSVMSGNDNFQPVAEMALNQSNGSIRAFMIWCAVIFFMICLYWVAG